MIYILHYILNFEKIYILKIYPKYIYIILKNQNTMK